MKPTAQQSIVDADHPWLGLESFTEATQKYFFGRDNEIADIFVRTRENPLTILYGQSGYGKTSLLGAGLIPKLKIEGFRPVLLRLRYEKTDAPLLDQLKDTLAGMLAHTKLGAICRGPETLWEMLHQINLRPENLASSPPILIFDQFEEAFTLGQQAERLEEVRALFTELADAIENRPPAALKQRFTEDRRLVRDFDLTPSPLRIVITLREEYLSHLEAWKRMLPSLMRNRMALHPLSGPQALDAVLKPGHMEGRHLVDEDTAACIVRFVADRRPDIPLTEIGAVPPMLSLLCEQLNAARLRDGSSQITADSVRDQADGILQRFYAESFNDVPDQHRSMVRAWVEEKLITDTEPAYRNVLVRDDAEAQLTRVGVLNAKEIFDTLIERRLLCAETRDRAQRLEITHDVLVPLLERSRKERRENEALIAAARTKRKKAILVVSLCCVAFPFVGLAVIFYSKSVLKKEEEAGKKAIEELKVIPATKESASTSAANAKLAEEFKKHNEEVLKNSEINNTPIADLGYGVLPNAEQAAKMKVLLQEQISEGSAELWNVRSQMAIAIASYELKTAELSGKDSSSAIVYLERAISFLQKAFDLSQINRDKFDYQETSIRIRFRIGMILADEGKTDEALAQIKTAIERVDSLQPWYQGAVWENDRSGKMAFYKDGEAKVRLKDAIKKNAFTDELTLPQPAAACVELAALFAMVNAQTTVPNEEYKGYWPFEKIADVLRGEKKYELARIYYERQMPHWEQLKPLVENTRNAAFDPDYFFPEKEGVTHSKLFGLFALELSRSEDAKSSFLKALESFRAMGVKSHSELWKAKGMVYGLYQQIKVLDQWLQIDASKLPQKDSVANEALIQIGHQMDSCMRGISAMISKQSSDADADLVKLGIEWLAAQIRALNGTLQVQKKLDGTDYSQEMRLMQLKNHDLAIKLLKAIQTNEAVSREPTEREIGAFAWSALTQEDLTGPVVPVTERFDNLIEAAKIRYGYLVRLSAYPSRTSRDLAFAKVCLAGTCHEISLLLQRTPIELENKWLDLKNGPPDLQPVPNGYQQTYKVLLERALHLYDEGDELLQSVDWAGWYRWVAWACNVSYVNLANKNELSLVEMKHADERRWRLLSIWSEAFVKSPETNIKGWPLLTLAINFEQTFSPPWLTGQATASGDYQQRHDPTPDTRKRTLNGMAEGMKAMKAVQDAWFGVMGNDFQDGTLDRVTKQLEDTKRNTWYSCHRIIRFWVHASLECLEKGERGPMLRDLTKALSIDLQRLRYLYDHETDGMGAGGFPETKEQRRYWIVQELRELQKLWQRISQSENSSILTLKKTEWFEVDAEEAANWQKLSELLDRLLKP